MKRFAAVLMCLFFTPTLVHAEFYRWVDNEGKEFYSNDPAKVPQEYRGSATKVNPDASRVTVGEKTVPSQKTEAAHEEHKDKHGRGEEYRRKRAANLRLILRNQQDEYTLVLKQLEVQEQKSKRLSSKEKKSHSILEKKKMKLEKDIAETRHALQAYLPEQARRANGAGSGSDVPALIQ